MLLAKVQVGRSDGWLLNDRTRLIDLLRKSPAPAGLFYGDALSRCAAVSRWRRQAHCQTYAHTLELGVVLDGAPGTRDDETKLRDPAGVAQLVRAAES